jgi:hypothetical protein
LKIEKKKIKILQIHRDGRSKPQRNFCAPASQRSAGILECVGGDTRSMT